MNIRFTSRLFLVSAVALILGGHIATAAAQGSCSDCIGGGSDVSGVLVSQDALVTFDGDVQARVNATAVTLVQALGGSSTPPASAEWPSEVDADAVALLTTTGADARAARRLLVESLTGAGLPATEASTLADAASGLLATSRVDAAQFLRAVDAFNVAVDVAPDAFVTGPPASFTTLRVALTSLLQATR